MNERTRLAPSPTGSLHLGNARTFLINWLLARRQGWKIILRIEDLDGPRIKRHADRQAIQDLQWLGLDWDEGPIYQSHRTAKYEEIIERLLRSGDAYPCVCSRRDVENAASAPHAADQSIRYPGTCRDKFASIKEAREMGYEPAIRFRTSARQVGFVDRFAGPKQFDAFNDLGDFIIAKADGTPSYQLAVAVDDLEMGIDHVVRGDDLLESTARQLLLLDAIDPDGKRPDYTHLPLVVGADGKRLAKRHGDSRLSYYRSQGVTATRIVRLLSRWCGFDSSVTCSTVSELISGFDLNFVSRDPIVFTPHDERSLFGSQTQ